MTRRTSKRRNKLAHLVDRHPYVPALLVALVIILLLSLLRADAADNVAITQGSGTTVAADEISSVQHQLIKIEYGTDGSATMVSATNPLPVVETYSGLYHLKAAASTNSQSVKASAGQIHGITAFNAAGATKYLKIYNKASAPTCGTDTPVLVFPLGAGVTTTVSATMGVSLATGIGVCITGAIADNDTTALSANDVILNLFYK